MEVLLLLKFFQKMSLAERWKSLLKKSKKDLGGLNVFEIIFQPLALAIHFPSFPPLLIPQRPLPSQSRLLEPGSTQPFNIALCKWNLARSFDDVDTSWPGLNYVPHFTKKYLAKKIISETSAYIAMELLFREILHIKEPLVGSLAFFHLSTEQDGSS